jgi:MFS family permease
MPPADKRSLFRNRDFALLFSGESISDLGTAVTGIAFPLVAIAVLHASAFEVGVVTAATNAAWLVVALPTGALVDRIRRRPVLIATDLLRAALLVTVPLAYAWHILTIGQLIVVAFGVSVGSVMFDIAYPAFLPSVVPEDRLVEGNGILEASINSAWVAGPTVGGFLVQLIGAPATLIADAASYLVSAITLGSIRASETHVRRDGPQQSMLRDIGEGLRYVMRHRMTAALTTAVTAANFIFGGYSAVIVVFLARQLGLAAGVIGVLFAVGAVGGVIGALVAGPLARRIGDARVLWLSAVLNVPAALVIPIASRGAGLAWFVVGQGVLNAGIALFNVCARAAIQSSAPSHLLGRVTASIRVFSRGALPVGSLVGGGLASAFSPRIALLSMLAFYAVAPLRLFLSPIGRVRTVAELNPASV